jgi:translocation and assembly module TamB
MAGRFAKSRRILGRILLLGAFLLSLVLVVDLPGVRGLVVQRLQELASVVTGEPVEIEDVRIHLWPPALTIQGLAMGEPGKAFIEADLVYAQPGLRHGKPVLAVLSLERPRARLVLDEEGLRGFTALRRGEATLSEFPWDELIVTSGYLEIEFTSVDVTIQVEGLEVRPDLQAGLSDLKTAAIAVRVGETWQRSQPTRVLGATLGPDVVRLPRVDLDFPMLDIWGRIEKDLDGKGFANVEIDLDLDELGKALHGSLRPSGRVRIDLEVDGPKAEGSFLMDLVLVDVKSEDRYDLQQSVGLFYLSPEGVVLQPLRWAWADGEVLVDGILGWNGKVEALRISGEGLDFARAMQLTSVSQAAWVDFDADLEAELAGTLSPLDLTGPFSITARDLRTGAGPMEQSTGDPVIVLPTGWVEGELALDGQGITLDAKQTVLGRTTGAVWARIGFEADGPLALTADVDLDLRDLHPMGGVPLAGRGRLVGGLRGPFDQLVVDAQVELRGFELFELPLGDVLEIGRVTSNLGANPTVLSFSQLTSRIQGTRLVGEGRLVFGDELGIGVELAVEQGSVADLVGLVSDVKGLDGRVQGSLSLHGSPNALDGEIDLVLGDVDLFGESFRTGLALARLEQGKFYLDEAVLERGEGLGWLRGTGEVAHGGAMDIQITGGDFSLADLDHLAGQAIPVDGVLDLQVALRGTLDDWEPSGVVHMGETFAGEVALQDSIASFATEDGLLVFEGDLLGQALWGRGTLELDSPFELHVDAGLVELPVDALIPRAADGRAVVARISGGLVLDGTLADRQLAGELVLDQVRMSWGAQELANPGPWRIALADGAVSLSGIQLAGGATWLDLQGVYRPTAGWEMTGGGPLDLAWLGAVIPEVNRSVGTAQVSFVQDVQGPSLEATGSLSMLQAHWFPHPFEEVQFQIRGVADGFVVRQVEGLVGGGRFVGGGTIEADGWVPTRFDLQASVHEAHLDLVEDLPGATASAELRLTGPPRGLLLSGDVSIDDMRFTERIDWESWLIAPGGELLVVWEAPTTEYPLFSYDLAVRADGTILVRNNVGEGIVDANLHVLGDTDRVGMTGWVKMRPGGTLTLQNRSFEVQRAELRYSEPWGFDPVLDFELFTRVASGDTDYAISYRVGGPYSDWSTAASSDPSLPLADINALLLFGMTREQVERAGGINAALLMEGLDLATGVRQGRAEARLTAGRLDVLPDRIDLVTGISPRGGSVSSDWRLLAQKELGDWTLTGDVNLADWDQRYWALERDLAGAMYLTLYRASMEEEAGLAIDGAWGADLVWRWELQ